MEKALPKGWVKTAFGAVNQRAVAKNIEPSKFPGEKFELYSVPIFETGHPEIQLGENIKSSKQLVERGDVLVCKINPRINRVWVVGDYTKFRKIASSEWIVVRNDLVNSLFLKYQFQSKQFRTLLQSEVSGVGGSLTRARPKLVNAYPLFLAPLPEQKRIVAKLDKLFAQHEKVKKALDRIPQLLKSFRQQVLSQAVSGKLTEQWREGREFGNWKKERLGNICDLKAGKFVPASEVKKEKSEGLFPCYGGNGLRGYVRSFTHNGKYSLIGRQGALCGNVHFVDGKFHATEHALVAKPHLSIDEIWLFHKLTSLKLNEYAKGVAQPGLSVINLNPILIDIPSLQEQHEIVRRLETLFAKVDNLEFRSWNLKQKIDILPQAILNKAFKGELVPQLPTDGDVENLLKEISVLKKGATAKKEKPYIS